MGVKPSVRLRQALSEREREGRKVKLHFVEIEVQIERERERGGESQKNYHPPTSLNPFVGYLVN